MKNSIQLILVCFIGLSFNSCYYDDEIPAEEIPIGTVLTYKTDIAPMLSACAACHNGTQSPDLRNSQQAYNGLIPNYVTIGDATVSKLYYYTPGNATSGHPNVGVTLSASNLVTLKYWIENEARYE